MLQVKLRPGLEFHNGKPLNATEVKRSLEAMDGRRCRQQPGQGHHDQVRLGGRRHRRCDVAATTGLGRHAGLRRAQLRPDSRCRRHPQLWTATPRSTAPVRSRFDPSSYQVDQYAAGERFENFYDPALLDGIELYQFPDATAMSLALGAGEIDLTNRLPKPDYERFNSDPDFTVVVAPPTLAIWVARHGHSQRERRSPSLR